MERREIKVENKEEERKELKHPEWVGTTYGNSFMHRWLIRLLKITDVRVVYAFARLFIVPPTMLFGVKGRRAMSGFFRQWKGYKGLKLLWNVYLNHCEFAEVVIDRFAMYAGKKFDIRIEGYDKFLNLAARTEGFIQLSSHIGNYELAGYSLPVEGKVMNALVFSGEKESVMANRNRMFGSNNIRMIPVAADMSHIFEINAALERGEILSMPADRIFGSQKSFTVDFLGDKAFFPQGPFLMAAMRDIPVLFVAVMKEGGKRYRIIVNEIEKQGEGRLKEKAESLAKEYVRLLESVVEEYPTQWYNYFDFRHASEKVN
ncbi:MAG: lysophospholipid acyltransferase family protein [Muribaculaceae bacterium]|nr:lysophospholipid acyltransferase family protein [Muribaculaceae bacterium]